MTQERRPLDLQRSTSAAWLALLLIGSAVGAHAQTITEFPVPTANSSPARIAAGPDGNLWFIEEKANKVGRITTAGVISEFPIPTAGGIRGSDGFAAGQDGNMWFGESDAGKIARVTPAGVITEFPVPTSPPPGLILLAGPDGNVWFVENGIFNSKVGKITPDGVISEFPIPTAGISAITNIAVGSDGNIWFADLGTYKIGRVTPAGLITEFSIPTANSNATSMAAGPDGNIWFAEQTATTIGRVGTKIGRITTAGVSVLTSLSHSADPTKGFRSNLGAYNPNDIAQTITFTLYDGSGTQLGQTTAAAPARTSVQVSNIFNVIGITTDVPSAYCVVAGDKSLALLTYAGVIDNQSQDLTYIQGLPNSRPAGPDRATIPVAASIHGAGGSFFHTDATVLNLSSSATANVTARYHCFSGSCGNATQTFALAPRQMRSFDDMIASLFSAPESGGAIQFDSDQPIVVNSRAFTPSRPAPTYGMGVPGLPETGEPTTAVLISLSYSANISQGFRSNVGAYNPNDVAQTITFTLYDPAGTQLGQASANAPARTSVQISNVFAIAGFTLDVPNAYCTVHGDQNLPLLVYAGVIDNQSQDLTFIKGENGLPP